MSLEAQTTDSDLEEILNLDPAVLKQILAEVFQKKPEELIKLEEEVKKADPAMIAEMQKQKPLLPTPYQTKTTTEGKKNKKNERNSEGVRASPPMVVKKPARQLKRAGRPVR